MISIFDQHRFLLKKVARSFYLTVRFLPSVLQGPVALAYLTARISDTLTDGEELALKDKEKTLRLLQDELNRGRERSDFLVIQSQISQFIFQFQGEKLEFLLLLPLFLENLYSKDWLLFEYEAMRGVWQKILEGQMLDVRNFSSGKIPSEEELDQYLYLVAGSVGEFLTKMAAFYFKNFSKESLRRMTQWGINYGKGLQLVNILRDRSEDQERDRCYYEDPQEEELYNQAFLYLQQGRQYVKSLRRGRLKYAFALPLLLAERTLLLIKKHSGQEKCKVSRWVVYGVLIRALPHLFF